LQHATATFNTRKFYKIKNRKTNKQMRKQPTKSEPKTIRKTERNIVKRFAIDLGMF